MQGKVSEVHSTTQWDSVSLPDGRHGILRSPDCIESRAAPSAAALRTISPGSLYLVDSPVHEAFIRNTSVFAALGFRMRPEYHDARLEVLEFVRLAEPIDHPLWIESMRDGRQALVIGTLRIDPMPPSYRPTTNSMLDFRPQPESWRTGTMESSITWRDSSEWIDALPKPLQLKALQLVASHSDELTKKLSDIKRENERIYPRNVGELLEHGLVTEQERRDFLNGIRINRLDGSFRESHGSSRTTIPSDALASDSAKITSTHAPLHTPPEVKPEPDVPPSPPLDLVSFRLPGT